MLNRASLLIAAFAACGTSVRAQPLEPTGKWVVDYAATQCTASHGFQEGGRRVIFGIIPMPNEEGYDLVISTEGSGADPAVEVPGTYGYDSSADPPTKKWVINFRTKSNQSGYRFHMKSAEMQKALSATSIWLRVPKDNFIETIPLSSIGDVLQALHLCVADLKQYWNTDGEKDGRIAVPPKGELRSLFASGDYPEEAMTRGQEGAAQYLLLVDETGKVAGCELLEASGVPAIDMMGCQVVKQRAKFTPARDAQGKPVRSTVVTPRISFQLGG